MALSVDRRTELQIDGEWTDITGDVREKDPVVIERGAKNESAKPSPSKMTLTLNNRHGRYSPRNPLSDLFGKIGRNTPVRHSLQGPESYLRLEGNTASYARTPDIAALDITGDLDIRIEATVDWWSVPIQTLIGKWVSVGNQRSYLLRLAGGILTLNWSPDGTAQFFASQPLSALPRRAAVRATLDVDNGSGGFTAAFYWAESLDGPWTSMGTPFVVTGTTSIYSGTAPLELGPSAVTNYTPVRGRVHRAEVRSGIGGTVVASPDLRALAEGATSWADPAGRTWTVGALASVTDREYRFHGEISSWPSRWDVSGSDVWVPIEAAGATRRMGQGKKALDSTLRRRLPSDPDLIAYWPMEDGAEATAAYSPVPGIRPMTMSGFDFAADDSLGGSSALPKAKNPSSFRAVVPRSSTQGWQVEFVYYLPTMPASQTEILRVAVAGSVMRTAVVYASTAGVRIEALDDEGVLLGAFLYNDAGAIADFTGRWNRMAVYTAASGGSTYLYVSWRNISANNRWISRTIYTGTQGAVVGLSGTYGADTADMVIGHLSVFDIPATGDLITSPPGSAIFSGADDGFNGETALDRLARLAAEEAQQVALSWIDGDATVLSEAMGPQRPDTLLALLEESAATDGGILYERLDATALVYRARTTRYNQPVALALDYTSPGEVPPPLEPVEDDQALRNDVTVTRRGGSSGRAVLEYGALSVQPPPDGVGPYDESLTMSLYTDEQPPLHAQWRMHLGTWDEARYPTITVWLHAAPHLVDQVLAMDIGDRVQISNPPAWLPPGVIDQHMLGYTERITAVEWSLAMNCAPAGPWSVGVYDDDVRGRYDTGGTRLASAVSEAATALPLTVDDDTRWVTDPAAFPFDVQLGGEVATVTAITGAAQDAFARTVASGWGAADSGQAWVQDGGTAAAYAVASGTGRLNLPIATFLASVVPVPTADVDLVVDYMLPNAPAGDSAYVYPVVRYTDDTHMYFARIQIGPTGVMSLTLRKRVGTESLLASYATGMTHSPGTWYRVRIVADGVELAAKTWLRSAAEPEDWQVSAADTDLTAPGSVGCRGYIGGSSTNTAPFVMQFDNLNAGPQTMKVTRSVNGITKPHTAGTDIRLAHPTIYAL